MGLDGYSEQHTAAAKKSRLLFDILVLLVTVGCLVFALYRTWR
jgi:hypothetical protein